MKLTQADVGKVFRTRGGQIAKITKMIDDRNEFYRPDGGACYPFIGHLMEIDGAPVSFTEGGRYNVTCDDEWDLVRPVTDEPSKDELTVAASIAETLSKGDSAPAALVTVKASLQDIARLKREYTITKISYNA